MLYYIGSNRPFVALEALYGIRMEAKRADPCAARDRGGRARFAQGAMRAELSSLDDQRRFGVTTLMMHEFEREVVDCVVPTSGLQKGRSRPICPGNAVAAPRNRPLPAKFGPERMPRAKVAAPRSSRARNRLGYRLSLQQPWAISDSFAGQRYVG